MIPFYENQGYGMRAFFARNLSFPLHLHAQLELLYVVEGSIEITVGMNSSVLEKGSCAIVFPNQIHSYGSKAKENSIITMICDLELCGSFMNKLVKYYPTDPFLSAAMLHENVHYSLEQLVKEIQGDGSREVFNAFVQVILARVFPMLSLIKNNFSEAYTLTYEIAQYIALNFTEPLTLEQLASKLCVSKYYLSRVFSNKMGTNFNEYLNSFRLDQAVALLQTTPKTISEICMEAGFESQRTFNRAFKAAYGTTPLRYRAGLD